MRRIGLVVLLVASLMIVMSARVFSGREDFAPAAVFPYDTIREDYVPALYFSDPPAKDDRLTAAPDFPLETYDLCYTPSLYYELWRITALQNFK